MRDNVSDLMWISADTYNTLEIPSELMWTCLSVIGNLFILTMLGLLRCYLSLLLLID